MLLDCGGKPEKAPPVSVEPMQPQKEPYVHAAVRVLRERFISFTVVSEVQMVFEDSGPQGSLKTAAPFRSRVHIASSECWKENRLPDC